jgi:hypothetical protein
MILKKKEIIIFSAILAAAIILWAGMTIYHNSQDHGSIRITVGGEEYGTYSLAKDQTIAIGTTNTCVISDGQVKMTDANCPDQLCMQMSAVDERGGVIVCLPNQVVIEGIPSEQASQQDDAVDSIVG